MEDPNSVRYAVYTPHVIDSYVSVYQERGGTDLFTLINGETFEVLHDPTLEEVKKVGRPKKEEE